MSPRITFLLTLAGAILLGLPLLCLLMLTTLLTACGSDADNDNNDHDDPIITPTTTDGKPTEGDGHNHSNTTTTTGHSANDGHDHGNADTTAEKVKYQIYTNADNTYRVVFRDAGGKAIAEFDNITKMPIKETMDADKNVYELSWATGIGPSDFACVYYNVKTGQVSELFTAPRGCDGTRIAYGSEDQKKVIVQDLFDKSAYYKEYELKNAVEKNGIIIVGGRLHENKKTVVIAYHSTETESDAHTTIELYE